MLKSSNTLSLKTILKTTVAMVTCIAISTSFAVDDQEKADGKKVNPEEGMIGRVTVEDVEQEVVFHYQNGSVFENGHLPMMLLEGKKFEITLRGELNFTGKTKVKISMAGGGVSHDVNWLYVDDKELGAVGDDRSKHLVKEMELDEGTHEVRWVLTGGTFRSNILLVQNADGEFIKIKTRKEDREMLDDDEQRQIRIMSKNWGWPIPLEWKELTKLSDPVEPPKPRL